MTSFYNSNNNIITTGKNQFKSFIKTAEFEGSNSIVFSNLPPYPVYLIQGSYSYDNVGTNLSDVGVRVGTNNVQLGTNYNRIYFTSTGISNATSNRFILNIRGNNPVTNSKIIGQLYINATKSSGANGRYGFTSKMWSGHVTVNAFNSFSGNTTFNTTDTQINIVEFLVNGTSNPTISGTLTIYGLFG